MHFLEYERAPRLLGSLATLRERKHAYLTRLARNNDVICLQETHGKGEFLQAGQVLVLQFRLFGTFTPSNVNAGGSAILICKNLLECLVLSFQTM